MLSSSPLMESFPSSRFPSPNPSPTKTETDLPIEVDQSFNSSMSISCAEDGSPTPSGSFLSPSFAIGKPLPPNPSFLSPTITRVQSGRPRRPDPVPIQSPSCDMMSIGMISTKRTFGREVSLNSTRSFGPSSTRGTKGMMLPPAVPDGKASSSRPRGGIPMKWSTSNEETTGVPKLCFQPALARHQVGDTTKALLILDRSEHLVTISVRVRDGCRFPCFSTRIRRCFPGVLWRCFVFGFSRFGLVLLRLACSTVCAATCQTEESSRRIAQISFITLGQAGLVRNPSDGEGKFVLGDAIWRDKSTCATPTAAE